MPDQGLWGRNCEISPWLSSSLPSEEQEIPVVFRDQSEILQAKLSVF